MFYTRTSNIRSAPNFDCHNSKLFYNCLVMALRQDYPQIQQHHRLAARRGRSDDQASKRHEPKIRYFESYQQYLNMRRFVCTTKIVI